MKPPASAIWRAQNILFFALLSSTFVYSAVVFMQPRGPSQVAPMMPPVLLGVGFMTMIVAAVLGKNFLPPLGEIQPQSELTDEPPLTDGQRSALGRLQVAKLITWALSEAIAIYGLIIGILLHDTTYLIPLWVLSLVSFALNRPSKEQFLRVIAGASTTTA